MGARYEVRGQVAVITLDNPPVNGLGYDTRVQIAQGVERAQADPDDVLEGPYHNACRRIDAAALDDPDRWVPTSRVERSKGGVRGD